MPIFTLSPNPCHYIPRSTTQNAPLASPFVPSFSKTPAIKSTCAHALSSGRTQELFETDLNSHILLLSSLVSFSLCSCFKKRREGDHCHCRQLSSQISSCSFLPCGLAVVKLSGFCPYLQHLWPQFNQLATAAGETLNHRSRAAGKP